MDFRGETFMQNTTIFPGKQKRCFSPFIAIMNHPARIYPYLSMCVYVGECMYVYVNVKTVIPLCPSGKKKSYY